MPKAPAPESLPTVMISPRGATRLKDGHVWVYRSDIVSADDVLPGSLTRVTDHRGKPLGSALYSSSSQIAIRMISHDHVADLPGPVKEAMIKRAAMEAYYFLFDKEYLRADGKRFKIRAELRRRLLAALPGPNRQPPKPAL